MAKAGVWAMLTVAVLGWPLAAAEAPSTTLREAMSERDFTAAGLHRLSAEELAHLEAWLAERDSEADSESVAETDQAAPAEPSEGRDAAADPEVAVADRASPAPAPAAGPTAEPTTPAASRRADDLGAEQLRQRRSTEQEERASLTARIDGEFRGWTGRTAFRLDNGQIWRQRGPTSRYYYPADNPEVRIERRTFGYHLTVVDTGQSVPVERIH